MNYKKLQKVTKSYKKLRTSYQKVTKSYKTLQTSYEKGFVRVMFQNLGKMASL